MGRREGEGEGGRGREGEGEEAETLAAARCVWASVFLSCRQLAVITEGGRVPSSQAVDLALTHIREHMYTHILYMCLSLLHKNEDERHLWNGVCKHIPVITCTCI